MLYSPLGPGAVSTIGGAGTTLQKFQSSIKTAAGAIIPFVSTVTDYLLPLPGQNKTNGIHFGIVASGNVFVHGTSPTLNFSLIGALPSTPTTDVVLATLTTPQGLTTNASYDWTVSLELCGSTAPAVVGGVGGSGQLKVLNGYFSIGGTTSLLAGMTLLTLNTVNFNGAYAAANPTTGQAAAFLKCGLTFGVSDALNLAALTEFYAYTEQ